MNKRFYSFYFLFFFGYGAFYPLLSVYLKDAVHLSGGQIGLIMSISPVVMIFIQPVWGLMSDLTRRPTALLTTALLLTALFTLLFSLSASYEVLIVAMIFLAACQSAVVPLSDSIALGFSEKSGVPYGSIRLWGALGFAGAVFFMGNLAETFHLALIFYTYVVFLILSAFFSARLPKENKAMNISLRAGIKELFKLKKYFLFLTAAFFMMGPTLAHNIYFGIYIQEIGGTLAGVGIAFLIAAGSEAPFMKAASRLIQRFGIEKVLMFAILISSLRWIFYYAAPSLPLVYATCIVQGFSVGLFIPAALQYVRKIAPDHLGATAISLYTAVGNGLGNWFCTFMGGLIYERSSALYVYLFFGILSTLSFLLIAGMYILSKKAAAVQSSVSS
ncbi:MULTISPECIES: MFS transporter [Bacillus]|uniref:MFS transporter n=1 Tax=Bacillus TaxID=1386 RepID=UPI00041E5093|nr:MULTISPECIES: MFS transporter [Bacillus]WFA04176.1 MFS transporter [Bacillus sp. HSf4]